MSRSTPAGRDPDAAVVGARIRAFRVERALSLRKLAELSGLSAGFLSQVERGLSSIALSSLRTVATALGRPVADFFPTTDAADDAGDGVVFTLNRAGGGPTGHRVVSGGRHYELLSSRAPGLVLEPMLVVIEPGGDLEEPTAHAGEEFAYVVQGTLSYEVDGVTHRLGVGDSLHLRSNTPHRMHNDTDELTVVVSVVTPRLL